MIYDVVIVILHLVKEFVPLCCGGVAFPLLLDLA